MMKIAFHDRFISERESTNAMIDYAYFNQSLLNNKSVIIFNKNTILNQHVMKKLELMFDCFGYNSFDEFAKIIADQNIDVLYIITTGNKNDIIPHINGCKNVVHAIFNYNVHGDTFACISEWMSKQVNNVIPFVPRMIDLPVLSSENNNMRKQLNIPDDAVVFGRYGSADTFNIDFVHYAITDIVLKLPNIYFLFANTQKFCETHPQIIHLDVLLEKHEKVQFINTCNAMLHARLQGETFGLAIGEFSSLNKPIITFGQSLENAHIDILGDKAIIYNTQDELTNVLTNFDLFNNLHTDWNCYKPYSAQSVMDKFKQVFLSDNMDQYNIDDYPIIYNNIPHDSINHAKAVYVIDESSSVNNTNDYWLIINNKLCGDPYAHKSMTKYLHCDSELLVKKYDMAVYLDKKQSHNVFVSNYFPDIATKHLDYKECKYVIVIDDNDGNFLIDDILNPVHNSNLPENLIIPTLCECFIFYHGSFDVSNMKNVISINVTDPQSTLQIIKNCIANQTFEQKYKFIKEQRDDIIKSIKPFDYCKFKSVIAGIIAQRLSNEAFTNKMFEKKYLINLDGFDDRLKKSDYELKLRHIDYEKYSAVNGLSIDVDDMIKNRIILPTFDGIHKKGVLGLIMTWYKFLNEQVANNYSVCLYIEDDIKMHHSFCDAVAENWNQIPLDADIITFTHWFVKGNKMTNTIHVDGLIYRIVGGINGTGCVAVTWKGAKKMLEKSFPLNQAIDSFNFNELNIYSFGKIPHEDSSFYLDTATIPGVTLNIHGIATTRHIDSCINSNIIQPKL